MSVHRQLAQLLVELEGALKTAGQWSDSSPPAEALASVQPFAGDTLSFAQWLQFIFIPRLSQLAEAQAELPRQSNVAAMAEMVWRMTGEWVAVVDLLRRVDLLLVAGRG